MHFKSQHWSHVAPQCQRLSQFLQHEVPRKDEIQNKCEGRKDMLQNIWEKELHTRSLFIKTNTYSIEAYPSFWSMKCQGRMRCKICGKEGRICETEGSMIQNMPEKVFFPLTSDGYLCTALKENCLHKSALEPCGPTMPKSNPVYTHLHSWVESGIVKGKCLAQEYITMTHTDIKPCHLDLQSCMLTVNTFYLPIC